MWICVFCGTTLRFRQLILSSVCFSTGQVVLRLNEQDVSIVVNEGNNVTFRCEIAGTITVSIRPPEGGPFVTNLPASVMTDGRDDLVTITVVDAQRDNNTVAFHCGVGGLVTNIGILTVYCKLCRIGKREWEIRTCLEPWECVSQAMCSTWTLTIL